MTIYRCLAGSALAAAVITGAAVTYAASDELAAKAKKTADATPAAQSECVSDTSSFKAEDRHAYFIVALENECEQRVKCEIRANIRTARGKAHGRATLILAPKSAGAEAKKSYSLRVKVAGGMAQVERNCTAF